MKDFEALARIFCSVRQAVLGTDGLTLIFANPAAEAAFGSEIIGADARSIIPVEILENDSKSFICAAKILGREVSVSVVREDNVILLFVDFIRSVKPALCMTRSIIGNLRNNAMGIKMSADRCFSMLEDGKVPSEKHISILYHYYYRLLRTLTQVDSADLLERGQLVFSPTSTDLVRLCSDLTDTVSALALETGIKISFSTDESEVITVVDPERIEQLLINLLSNSLQNCSAGNSISISLRRAGNRIVISADDDGSGIPQEILSKIFTLPDSELDLSKPQTGSGLGLYIAYGIAQLHKGVLLIESREGEGTHVRVMLPVDETSTPKFSTPGTPYRRSGVSAVLTGLSDVLSSNCFGLKFED